MKFVKMLLMSSALVFLAVGCVRPQSSTGPTSEQIEASVPTQDTPLKDLNQIQREMYQKVVEYFTAFNQEHGFSNDPIDESKYNVSILDQGEFWQFRIYEVPPEGEIWLGSTTVVTFKKKTLDIVSAYPGR